ncbi:hypothetical protein J1N35_004706 [Gossypium stocksii]|uniref:Uncharacterized protein n=1 Tax=Gossypium stocksii TaxID=47602 RepID=A0A9D3WCP5_9ROSI|nr:hypothetical protein J1N35_004706 [Gossypium stocksii]
MSRWKIVEAIGRLVRKDLCLSVVVDLNLKRFIDVVVANSGETVGRVVKERGSEYGLWMLVERRSRCLAQHISTSVGVETEGVDKGVLDTRVRVNGSSKNFRGVKAHYNPTFEESEGTLVLIFNRALDLGKHSTEYNLKYKLDISLLEPRVSGSEADNIITKLGFQYSHRVEEIGYFEGIWIGCKDFIRVEVDHPNFESFVKENWIFTEDMFDTLGKFTHNLKEWNKSVYGHITARKRFLVNKLANVQWKIDLSGSNYLTQVELKIH